MGTSLKGPVVGVWRGKDKSYFDNVSLIDSDSFQVSSGFPNLIKTKQCISHIKARGGHTITRTRTSSQEMLHSDLRYHDD